jgi:hypothetical protein
VGGEAWVSEGEERVREGVRRGKSGGGELSAKVSSMHFLLSLFRQGDVEIFVNT